MLVGFSQLSLLLPCLHSALHEALIVTDLVCIEYTFGKHVLLLNRVDGINSIKLLLHMHLVTKAL